jgi:hypothetical protein
VAVHFPAQLIAVLDICFSRRPDDMTFNENSERLALHAGEMFAHVVT